MQKKCSKWDKNRGKDLIIFQTKCNACNRRNGTDATLQVPGEITAKRLARSLSARSRTLPPSVDAIANESSRRLAFSLRKERQQGSTAMPSVTGHRIWFHGRCPLSYSCVEIVKISRGYPPLNWIAATCSLFFSSPLPPNNRSSLSPPFRPVTAFLLPSEGIDFFHFSFLQNFFPFQLFTRV